MNREIKVIIVDDSAVVRQVMVQVLSRDPEIRIIAHAMDPIFAMEKMKKEWPDVIILDVEMPRMDGITFLRKIMAEHPTPVIICSSLTEKGAETTMQALAAGAFAIFTKPSLGVKGYLVDASSDLVAAVRAAAGALVAKNLYVSRIPGGDTEKVPPQAALPRPPQKLTADAVLAPGFEAMAVTTERFTAIGTSTGGTQALEFVLSSLPRTCPGLVVVQHMPEKFTAAFAQRLDRICEIEVREARSGDRVIPGRAIIAPGGQHLVVKRSGAQYVVEVVAAPPVNRHCPSVDVLFRSCAKYAGRNATGVIMTGMGDDGARGLLEMHQAGARTLAQDEESCVVFGMPKEAIKLGAAERVVPLSAIPELIAR
jgi:two-component system chemotaxis response regulator CheB